MRTSTRILVNTTAEWSATTINVFIGIAIVPLLIHYLGEAGYGLTGLILSISTITVIAGYGLSGALSRHLAEQLAFGNSKAYNTLASTAACYCIAAGTISVVICWFAAPYLVILLNIPAVQADDALFLIRYYCGAAAIITLIQSLFQAIIISHNRFAVIHLVDAATNLLKATGFYVVLSVFRGGLVGWSLVLLVANAGTLPVLWGMAHQVCPTLVLRLSSFSQEAFGKLFGLGKSLFLIRLTRLLSITSDPIVLSMFLGPSSVATYTPAVMLSNAVRPMIDTLSQQLHPLATAYHVTDSQFQLRSLLIRGTRFTMLMGTGACVFLAMFATPIMQIWLKNSMGASYTTAAAVLVLWSIVDFTNYAAGTQWPILLGMNRLRVLVWSQIVPAILNICLSIFLLTNTNLGVVGVVLPTVVINIVRRPLIAAYCAKVCKLPPTQYFRDAYATSIILLGALLLCALILRTIYYPRTLFELMVIAAIYVFLWAGLAWVIGLPREDRNALKTIFRHITAPLHIDVLLNSRAS